MISTLPMGNWSAQSPGAQEPLPLQTQFHPRLEALLW